LPFTHQGKELKESLPPVLPVKVTCRTNTCVVMD